MHRGAAGTCGGLHGVRVCTGGLSLHLVRVRPPQPRQPRASVRSVATAVRTEAPAARAPTECWERACAGARGARPPQLLPHRDRLAEARARSAHALRCPPRSSLALSEEGAEPQGGGGGAFPRKPAHTGFLEQGSCGMFVAMSASTSPPGLLFPVLICTCPHSTLKRTNKNPRNVSNYH